MNKNNSKEWAWSLVIFCIVFLLGTLLRWAGERREAEIKAKAIREQTGYWVR